MARILLINPPVLAADLVQFDLYVEPYPYGLLQIGAWLKDRGDEVHLLDMMGYDVNAVTELGTITEARLTPWGRLRAGGRHLVGLEKDVYWYGLSLDVLRDRLRALGPLDEVWVTCAMNFNRPPAFAVIRVVREMAPGATIRFGGAYPTCSPEDARGSGADEIFQGRMEEADRLLPDFGLTDRPVEFGLFRLSNGCDKRCSFCVNGLQERKVFYPVEEVRDYLHRTHETYGITEFTNQDPNIMLFPDTLHGFLEMSALEGWGFGFKFDMGVQPGRLDRPLLEKMRDAGVRTLTVPVESVDAATLKRMRKHYSGISSFRVLRDAAALGFDVSRFHCTFIIGLPYDDLRSILRLHHAILHLGALPCVFPISVVPGSLEHERYEDRLEGKSMEELNGHLWPLVERAEDVEMYDALLNVLYLPYSTRAEAFLDRLPGRIQDLYHEERERAPEYVAALLDAPKDSYATLDAINARFDAPGGTNARSRVLRRDRSPLEGLFLRTLGDGLRIARGTGRRDGNRYSSVRFELTARRPTVLEDGLILGAVKERLAAYPEALGALLSRIRREDRAFVARGIGFRPGGRDGGAEVRLDWVPDANAGALAAAAAEAGGLELRSPWKAALQQVVVLLDARGIRDVRGAARLDPVRAAARLQGEGALLQALLARAERIFWTVSLTGPPEPELTLVFEGTELRLGLRPGAPPGDPTEVLRRT
ncbi:MAG: B12-binding domain-containing radical SAM protein [Pseudomonadota bacterium]